MSKKRIAFVIHDLGVGGAEHMISNLSNHISRETFEVHLIVFKAHGLYMRDIKSDVILHDLGVSSVKKGLFALMKKLYQLQPDRVFSGMGYVNSLLSFLIPFLNLISRNPIYWVARETNIASIINKREPFTAIIDWLYRHTYKNFDLIVCQSNYMKQDLIQNYQLPEEQMVIINNPVDLDHIDRLGDEPLEYPFEKHYINLVSVGVLRQQKRFDVLLEILAKLDDRYRLTIVGGGMQKDDLKAYAKTLGVEARVAFVGHQDNPYPYMKQANLMILSSEYEGFPNVLLEANVCGLPIIAFACPGGTEEIIIESLNGHLIPCLDKAALLEAIQQCETRQFSSTAIRHSVADRYALPLIIKQYEEVLR